MRYYAKYDENNKLVAIGTSKGDGTEITKEEYSSLLAEIKEKASLVDSLYNADITIDDVPEEWREEIQQRVDERIQLVSEYTPPVNETELKAQAYDILTGAE